MAAPSVRTRLLAIGVATAVLCGPLLLASSAQAALRSRLVTAWSDTSVTLGHPVAVRGTVRPARSPRTVVLQRRTRRGWVAVSTRRTRDGAYRLRVPTLRTGTYRYRVRATRDRAATAALGGARSVVVTRPKARGKARSFSFMGQSGNAVARWNPCEPIGYRVNARLGGARALADVKRAVARIRQTNGLRFAYRGRTRIIPGGRNDGRYPKDTQLVISWARPAQSHYLGQSGVAGVGGPQWTSAVNRRGDYDLMITKGFAVLNADLKLAGGFGAGPRRGWQGTRGQLLMHEIGHAVGMGHADQDAWQILYPTMTRKRAVWGAGDLRGLTRLGAAKGCLSTGSSIRGLAGPRTWTEYLP
jgi:hypothetical protein